MKADPKHLLPLLLSVALTGHVAAEDAPDVIEKIRVVIPADWEVGRQAGTPNVTVTRKAAIPPADLAYERIPSSPAFGEGSENHAKLNGIRVWFTLEPVGACSAAEHGQRKARNAEIRAQLEPLRKKIERIPGTPGVKPGLLSRTPRNEEEKSWLAEYAEVSSKRLILPTHHFDGNGFLVTLVKSYYGASITSAIVADEVHGVRKAIEKVLVPYESAAKPPDAEIDNQPKQTDLVSQAMAKPDRNAATVLPRISKAIEAGPTFATLSGILGEPDLDIGSGIHIFVYRLSDGTGITVGTPDKKKVMYIEHANKRLFPIKAEQGAGPVIRRGDKIGKYLGEASPLRKSGLPLPMALPWAGMLQGRWP